MLSWGAITLLSGGLALFQLHNDDAFFHVATGRWIREHGRVPLENPFSFAQDGAVWLQHQWLPAVGISWIVDHLGIAALVWIKAALVMVIFAILALHLHRRKIPLGAGALLLAVGISASAFRFYERPFLVSTLALTGVAILLLDQASRAVMSRRALLVAAGITALAWQLHAGALYTVLTWGAFTVGLTLRTRSSQPLRLAWGAFVFALTLSALGLWALAPNGLAVIALPFRFSANAYWNAHLAEFRHLRWSWTYGPQWVAMGVGVLVTMLAMRSKRWDAVLLVLGFSALAIKHQRLVWVMVVATLAAAGALPWSLDLRARLSRPLVNYGLVALSFLVMFGAWQDQSRWFRMGIGEDGLDHRRHPVALLRAAKDLPGETFVSDGLAGTWLWLNYADRAPDGSPLPPLAQRRVLIHNCLECYKESTYIDLYQHIRYALPGWEQKVRALGIRSFVLKHTTPGERRFQNGRPNIRQRLFDSSKWALVDFNDVASVYAERGSLPVGCSTLEPFLVDPDTGRAVPGVKPLAIMLTLIDHALSHPNSTRTLDMAARRAWRAGDKALALLLQAEVRRRDQDGPTSSQLAVLMGRSPVAEVGTLRAIRERLSPGSQRAR